MKRRGELLRVPKLRHIRECAWGGGGYYYHVMRARNALSAKVSWTIGRGPAERAGGAEGGGRAALRPCHRALPERFDDAPPATDGLRVRPHIASHHTRHITFLTRHNIRRGEGLPTVPCQHTFTNTHAHTHTHIHIHTHVCVTHTHTLTHIHTRQAGPGAVPAAASHCP